MLPNIPRLRCIVVSACALAAAPALAQTPVGTAFTYAGRLTDAGVPANGAYDLQFVLYTAATGGSQVGPIVTLEDVTVANGLFAVKVDFGTAALAGEARWLEVAARPGSGGTFVVLSPRQELTPTPNAIFSQKAPWTGITGIPSGFVDGIDDDTLAGLACASGQIAKWNGSAWGCAADADSGGSVTSVTASSPLSSSGGATPNLTLSGTVPVASGGTGTGSTLSGVLLGGSPFSSLAASSGDQLLRRNSAHTAYEFVSPSGGGSPVGTGRSLLTGSSLLGGGDLSADRTLDLNLANANSWTAQQTFAPAANVTGAVVRQTSAASPTADVFAVQNSAGSGSFLRVGSTGMLSWNATANGDISGSAASFTGSLSGDVTGTQSATTVAGLRGRTLSTTAPTSGQVLKWSGTDWAPAADATGSGTVTQVATGAGLTGGPITSTGTVSVASGGVDTSMLADGAVSSAKIANGAVGSAQINTAQVQARVGGTCPPGHYLRGINTDGTVLCEPVLPTPWVPTVTATVDAPANDVGWYTSIAIGTEGLPIISYHDLNAGTLKVVKCGNPGCTAGNTITTVDDPVNNVGGFTSIAIGTEGLPIISYHDFTAGALKVAHCGNADCTAGNSTSTVDDPLNHVGDFTSIAVGADGLPVISYNDDTASALKVAHCGNPACTSGNDAFTVDDPANEVGDYNSIAIGSDGLPVISYYDTTAGALKVVHCGNAACSTDNSTTTVDDPGTDVGYFTSIAIGLDGLPVIGYCDNTTGVLKMAHCGNAACTAGNTISTVDGGPNHVGWHTSTVIGSDGLPVISYYDVTARALKVAHCGNPACTAGNTVFTVDDPANDVGEYTSIAIGADGLPVISYHDATAQTLKVAKCGSRTCQ